MIRLLTLAALGLLLLAGPAQAQSISVDLGSGAGLTERAFQLAALITVLSLAPSLLIMTTSFVRITVVLSMLRTAIGLQTAPPNAVLISLALFLTAFVMQPTWEAAWEAGAGPIFRQEITLEEGFPRAVAPIKDFMLAHSREQDLALFIELAKIEPPETPEAVPLRIVAPAFMVSELKRAFEIGFMLFVPFIIIDLVVASLLMSLGMVQLPPITVSLPFKVIFFVLVDGWRLVAGSLVESFIAGPPPGG